MLKDIWTGRSLFLQLLIDEGITHLFGNPGTTELAIMEAVPNFPQLKYVLGLQESLVVAMADGVMPTISVEALTRPLGDSS